MLYEVITDSLIYPQKLGAREIVNLLSETGTSEVFNFYGDKLSLFVIRLEEDAPIINKRLDEVAVNNKDQIFKAVAISRNDKTIIPNADETFKEGDIVFV